MNTSTPAASRVNVPTTREHVSPRLIVIEAIVTVAFFIVVWFILADAAAAFRIIADFALTAAVGACLYLKGALTGIKLAAGLLLATAIYWYLAIYDSASDDDVLGGLDQLWDSIWRLPDLLFGNVDRHWPFIHFDMESYGSWWTFVTSDRQGFGTISGHMWDHAQIVLASITIAIVLGVGLGIIGHRVPAIGGVVLAAASIGLTIPSLALFAVLMTIDQIGIGNRGPILALALYSLLPILRNTMTGLNEVDGAIIESAKGTGLSPFQRLFKIEFPLAWPVILTGIRVSTLLNIGIAAIAVLVGGTGLGIYINQGLNLRGRANSLEMMWTGVVFIVVLALIADLLVSVIRVLTTSKGIRK